MVIRELEEEHPANNGISVAQEVPDGESQEVVGEEWTDVGNVVKLSLNSVVGLTTLETMKLRGSMGIREVVVLLNCGASHNFIQ